VLNDRRWKLVALVDVFHLDRLPEPHLAWQYPKAL
jgi:hypothetical protein